jgi:ABC-type microcin C transport system permease subunit YejB
LFAAKLEVATSFAIFIWVMSFVVVVPVGLIWALKEGLNWRKLRDLGREASHE